MKYNINFPKNPFDEEAYIRLIQRELHSEMAENIRLKRELDDLKKNVIFHLLILDLLSVLSTRNVKFVPSLPSTRFSLILLPRLSSGWMVRRLLSNAKKAKSFLNGPALHSVLQRNCTVRTSIKFSELIALTPRRPRTTCLIVRLPKQQDRQSKVCTKHLSSRSIYLRSFLTNLGETFQ